VIIKLILSPGTVLSKILSKVLILLIFLPLHPAIIWALLGTRGINGKVIDYNKVAVPSEGSTIDSVMSKYFGKAPCYIVYDTKKKGYWTVQNPFYNKKHARGLRVSAMLVNKGVGTTVSPNIGPEPARYFNNNNVKMYIGASGTVRDAINQYLSGKLVRTEQPNVPTHYGVSGAKPCPNVLGQPKKRIPPRDLQQNNLVAASWIPAMSGSETISCPYCYGKMMISHIFSEMPYQVVCPYCRQIISLDNTQFLNKTNTYIR
jgi:predicted Fe-Mo cluster-binding NifX family protein